MFSHFLKPSEFIICNLPYSIIFFFLISSGVFAAQQDKVDLTITEKLLQTKPDSALFLIKQLLNKAIDEKDILKQGICYQQIGEILYHQGINTEALKYHYKAQTLFNKQKDDVNSIKNLNKIGRIYLKQPSNPHALSTFQEALYLSKKIKYIEGVAESYGHIGMVYEKKRLHDSSFKYQDLALSAYQTINNKNGIARIYENIGTIYEHKAEYNIALKYFYNVLKLYQEENNRIEQAEVINNIGDMYRKTARYANALSFTKKALLLASSLNDLRQIESAHHDLAKTFELLNSYDSAYYYNDQARLTNLRIAEANNDVEINLLQILYEVQQKDNEIKHLEADKQLNRILVITISLIGILIISLGWNILSKQKLKIENSKALLESQKIAMGFDLNNKHLLQENLKAELEVKSKELTSHTLLIIQKNELLEDLKNKLNTIIKDDKRDQRKELKQLINQINFNTNQDKNWENFRKVFENVHADFFDKLKQYSNLSPADLRLLALLKMNLPSADISTMIGISQDSLRTSKYRLRKKLQIPEEIRLTQFIQQL